MTPVYHVAGCGEVAFYFLVDPYEGMKLTPEVVVYPDGSVPPTETKALCFSCHQDLAVTELTIYPPKDAPPPEIVVPLHGDAQGEARP